MPDNRQLFDAIDALPLLARLAALEGMREVAPQVQAIAVSNARDVIYGMSGATFASTRLVVGVDDDPDDETAQSGYEAATERLTGFTLHDGAPHIEDDGEALGELEVRAALTAYTTYAADLETDGGGRKAYLGDSLLEQAPRLFDGACRGLRRLFRD